MQKKAPKIYFQIVQISPKKINKAIKLLVVLEKHMSQTPNQLL